MDRAVPVRVVDVPLAASGHDRCDASLQRQVRANGPVGRLASHGDGGDLGISMVIGDLVGPLSRSQTRSNTRRDTHARDHPTLQLLTLGGAGRPCGGLASPGPRHPRRARGRSLRGIHRARGRREGREQRSAELSRRSPVCALRAPARAREARRPGERSISSVMGRHGGVEGTIRTLWSCALPEEA